MYVIVSPDKLELSPGSVLRSLGTWQDYLRLYDQRGEGKSLPRLKYRSGEILLMAPLPTQGRGADLLADIAKVLLDAQSQEYESFTPITMTLPGQSGIEPDHCFYIQNWEVAAGKERIDWEVEPGPDLVIEVDVTSYTNINDYLPYQVLEIWLWQSRQLKIYGLENNAYVERAESRYFPGINLFAIVEETVQVACDRNTSFAIRSLRQKLQNPNP
jgi:Uma2 family endonuclease